MAQGLPGPYNITETIQGILQKRRDESRQALIDKLNEEQMRAQMDYQQGQLDLGQKAEARASASDAWQKQREQLGMIPGGADPSTVDPLLVEQARRLGLVQSVPERPATITGQQTVEHTPTAPQESKDGTAVSFKSGVEQPYLPGSPKKEAFVGDEKYQERTRFQGGIDTLIDRFKDDPDMLRALLATRETGQALPESLTGPEPSLFTIGPTGKIGKSQPTARGAQGVQLSHPPASYLPAFTPYYDPGTNRSFALSNRMGPNGAVNAVPIVGPNQQPISGQIERVGGPDQTPDMGLQQAATQMRMAVSGTSGNRAQAIAAARSAVLTAAGRQLSPEGYQAMQYMIQNFSKGTRPPTVADVQPAMQVLQMTYPNLQPQDIQVIQDAMGIYLSAPLR